MSGLSRAERIIAFVESLPCTSGPLAGTNFKLRPWQKKFIRAVFKTDKQGKRLVRTAVLSMGRGGGKTTLAAALALCFLAGPEAESRGEIVSAANDRSQAARIFNEMAAIIERVPWLADRVSIKRFTKELVDIGGTGSTYAALSRESGTKAGLAPSVVIYDELGQSEARDLLDALDTAMGKRAEPLMLVISTQAAREDAPLSQLIQYGLRVQRGEIIDPTFHLTLFSAPSDADPWKPATWKLANPALGDFRSLKDVERLALQAQRIPSAEASFRNYVLNQKIDATQNFISPGVWAMGNAPVDMTKLAGRKCYAGIDLGSSRDLTALVLAFADDNGGFDIVPYFWLPDDDLREREDTDHVTYVAWRDKGYLQTVPGKTMDFGAVALKLAELNSQYHFEGVAFDRWKIADLQRELEKIGADLPLIEHGMGFKDMRHAVDELERLAVEGKLRHGAHPILTWCMSNARTTADPAGNRKLDKARSINRIDGAVALGIALSIAGRHHPEPAWEPFLAVV